MPECASSALNSIPVAKTALDKTVCPYTRPASYNPTLILRAVRMHWQVENSLHWILDVTFNEDDCQIRDANAAVNFSWMPKFALGLLKNETSFKASIRRKQRTVCTNIFYLAELELK